MLEFLTSTDVESHEVLPIEDDKPVVQIRNSDFSWDSRDEKATLHNINLPVCGSQKRLCVCGLEFAAPFMSPK